MLCIYMRAWACMHVCVSVQCMRAWACMHVCVSVQCMRVWACMHDCMCVSMQCMRVSMHACVWACNVCVCEHACMCVCEHAMYACVSMQCMRVWAYVRLELFFLNIRGLYKQPWDLEILSLARLHGINAVSCSSPRWLVPIFFQRRHLRGLGGRRPQRNRKKEKKKKKRRKKVRKRKKGTMNIKRQITTYNKVLFFPIFSIVRCHSIEKFKKMLASPRKCAPVYFTLPWSKIIMDAVSVTCCFISSIQMTQFKKIWCRFHHFPTLRTWK